MIFNEINADVESKAINKLLEVCNIQSSIALLTEEIYKNQIKSIKSQLNKSNERKSSETLLSHDKSAEIYINMSKIIQENSQFLNAVQRNLVQIGSILKPNIVKTFNLLDFIEDKIPKKYMNEFVHLKNDIEIQFNNSIEYLNSFFENIDDFNESTANFDKFSDISHNEFSVHMLETEEIDLQRSVNTKEKRYSLRSSTNEDILFGLINEEMHSDLENIRRLRKIVETVEKEKKNQESLKKGPEEIQKSMSLSFSLVSNTVNEVLDILKNIISLREIRIKKLKLVQNENKLEKTDELNTLYELSDIKPLVITETNEKLYRIDNKYKNNTFKEKLNNSTSLDSRANEINKFNKSNTFNSTKKFTQNLRIEDGIISGDENSEDKSSEIGLESLQLSPNFSLLVNENISLEKFNKLASELESAKNKHHEYEAIIKGLQVQDSQQKKKINVLILESDRLMLFTNKFKNTKIALKQFILEFNSFKEIINREHKSVKLDIQA